MKVSVIIPAYNAEAYVAEAIASVIAQDLRDVEVIVVDDGSRDRTREEVEKMTASSTPVRYVYEENQGAAIARNTGIALGRGEYLRFVDADDWLYPDSLMKQVELMDSHPRADLCFGQSFTVAALREPRLQRPLPRMTSPAELDSRTAFRWLLQGGGALRMSTVMARTQSVLDAGLFKPQAVPSEDWNLYMTIASTGWLLYLPEPMAFRREHPASVMANLKREQYVRSHLYTLGTLFRRPDAPHRDLRHQAYASCYLVAAKLAAQAGDRRQFASFARRAMQETPWAVLRPEMGRALYHGLKSLLPRSFRDAARHSRVRIRGRRHVQRVS